MTALTKWVFRGRKLSLDVQLVWIRSGGLGRVDLDTEFDRRKSTTRGYAHFHQFYDSVDSM